MATEQNPRCSLHSVCVCVWESLCVLPVPAGPPPSSASPPSLPSSPVPSAARPESAPPVCPLRSPRSAPPSADAPPPCRHTRVELGQNDICVSNLRICDEHEWQWGSVTAVHPSTSGPGRRPSCPSSASPLSWWTSLWLHAAVSASLSPPANTQKCTRNDKSEG